MNPTIQDRIERSKSKLVKAVFPNTTNHYDTLFGGTALQLMDEISFICATRFSKKRVVTISTDKIDFKLPIPGGTIIELLAKVIEVGRTSLKVQVEINVEDMYSDTTHGAISGVFTFVAIDNNRNPIPILD